MKNTEKNIIKKSWHELLDMGKDLIRVTIPVQDCDLVVYHRQGQRKTNKIHIIFYHGACGRSQMWQNQYYEVPEYDFYFINVRGQGESLMKKGLPDLEGAISDVLDIMNYFQMEKAILVGHSWGGNPLQEFTYRFPEKVQGLVLVGSWGQHRYMSPKDKNALKYSKIMYQTIPWSIVGDRNAKACSNNPETRALIKKSILETGRDIFINLGMSGFEAVHEIDAYKGNPPMLLIRGAEDFPKQLSEIYSNLEKINPNARQVVIPDTRHQPMNDSPIEFNKILGEFLKEVGS